MFFHMLLHIGLSGASLDLELVWFGLVIFLNKYFLLVGFDY